MLLEHHVTVRRRSPGSDMLQVYPRYEVVFHPHIFHTMTDTTTAEAPFNHPDADVILETKEEIDSRVLVTQFRVHKIFLSLASPIFASMFSLPQPANPGLKDGTSSEQLPVIPFEESTTTVRHVLNRNDHQVRNGLLSTSALFAARRTCSKRSSTCLSRRLPVATQGSRSPSREAEPRSSFARDLLPGA